MASDQMSVAPHVDLTNIAERLIALSVPSDECILNHTYSAPPFQPSCLLLATLFKPLASNVDWEAQEPVQARGLG